MSLWNWKRYKLFLLVICISFGLLLVFFIWFLFDYNSIIGLLSGFCANIVFGAIVSWLVQWLNDKKIFKQQSRTKRYHYNDILSDISLLFSDQRQIEYILIEITGGEEKSIFHSSMNDAINIEILESNMMKAIVLLKLLNDSDNTPHDSIIPCLKNYLLYKNTEFFYENYHQSAGFAKAISEKAKPLLTTATQLNSIFDEDLFSAKEIELLNIISKTLDEGYFIDYGELGIEFIKSIVELINLLNISKKDLTNMEINLMLNNRQSTIVGHYTEAYVEEISDEVKEFFNTLNNIPKN